jgi:hypothetical protein
LRADRRGSRRAIDNLLQVRSQIGDPLIPSIPILLERLRDDVDSAAGTLGAIVDAGGGVRFNTASKTVANVAPVNGGRPVAIWVHTMPSEKMSVRASTVSPRACSGDM